MKGNAPGTQRPDNVFTRIQRLAEKQRLNHLEEPDAGNLHVRIRGGPDGETRRAIPIIALSSQSIWDSSKPLRMKLDEKLSPSWGWSSKRQNPSPGRPLPSCPDLRQLVPYLAGGVLIGRTYYPQLRIELTWFINTSHEQRGSDLARANGLILTLGMGF